MFNDETRDQFVGFMVWSAFIAGAIYVLRSLTADHDIAARINAFSPWAGAHLETLTTCVAVLLVCAGAAFPALSMMKDDRKLEVLGYFSSRLFVVLGVPIVFFVLGAIWYSGHS